MCEWALGQRYKSLHVDEPSIVRSKQMILFCPVLPLIFLTCLVCKDWHFNYDQKKFLLMPTLETIEAFETRRAALELVSPSDDPPDIMLVSSNSLSSIIAIANHVL